MLVVSHKQEYKDGQLERDHVYITHQRSKNCMGDIIAIPFKEVPDLIKLLQERIDNAKIPYTG